MFEGFAWLPAKSLAACVHVAANMCLSVWDDFERAKYGSSKGRDLLEAYELWCKGQVADSELKARLEQFYGLLPEDLRRESDPTVGFAGWAILGVAQIVVGDCPEIIHSTAYSSILYAAGSACRSGHKMIAPDLDALNDCELRFLSQWWERCGQQQIQMTKS